MHKIKLTQVMKLRDRVNRGQVRCDFPGCTTTGVQVISYQVGVGAKFCLCLVACRQHLVNDPRDLLSEEEAAATVCTPDVPMGSA